MIATENFPDTERNIFADFESDPHQYEMSKRFWRLAFQQALDGADSSWMDWMDDPLHDGHPIFSVLSTEKNRGIVVQQTPPSDDKFSFKCWVDRFDLDDGRGYLPYLFVETFVSQGAKQKFLEICRMWALTDISTEQMDRVATRFRLDAQREFTEAPSS